MKTRNRCSNFAKKPFRLGNLLFLIHFRYAFLGFPGIPSTDPTKRYHFCFECIHNFDCARNAKTPAVDSGANPCNCLDVFFVNASKIGFHLAGESPCENEKTSTFLWSHWNISTKRCFFVLKASSFCKIAKHWKTIIHWKTIRNYTTRVQWENNRENKST